MVMMHLWKKEHFGQKCDELMRLTDKEGVSPKQSMDDDVFDDIVHRSIKCVRLCNKVVKGVIVGRVCYNLLMDYSTEDCTSTYYSWDKIKKLPKLLLANADLVVSMPLAFLQYIGKQTTDRYQQTRWIQVDSV